MSEEKRGEEFSQGVSMTSPQAGMAGLEAGFQQSPQAMPAGRGAEGLDGSAGGPALDSPAQSSTHERVKDLLAPLSREVLIDLICEAAEAHPEFLDRVHETAVRDPNSRKLFVRGLSWDTTNESLAQAFSQYGEVEEAAVIMDRPQQRSKGYGFVTYTDVAGAQAALQSPTKIVDGRNVTCNLAALGKRESQTPGPMKGPAHPGVHPGDVDVANRKLFVRSLAWETTDEGLANAFAPFGELEEAAVARDRTTGKSRGFGFVTFKNIEGAQKALVSPVKRIDGRDTHCNLASQGPKKQSAMRSHPLNSLGLMSMPGEMPGYGMMGYGMMGDMGGMGYGMMGGYGFGGPGGGGPGGVGAPGEGAGQQGHGVGVGGMSMAPGGVGGVGGVGGMSAFQSFPGTSQGQP